MREPDAQPGTESNGAPGAVAPLFRPEALEANARNFYGEILLVRPLSLAFLCWLGAGLAAVAAAVLFFGSYTETGHVTGMLRLQEGRIEAHFEVPARWKAYLYKGQRIPLHCRSCADPGLNYSTGTITEIFFRLPDGPRQETFTTAGGNEPPWTVVVNLGVDSHSSFRAGARIEAAVPLARHRFFHWIFGRSAA